MPKVLNIQSHQLLPNQAGQAVSPENKSALFTHEALQQMKSYQRSGRRTISKATGDIKESHGTILSRLQSAGNRILITLGIRSKTIKEQNISDCLRIAINAFHQQSINMNNVDKTETLKQLNDLEKIGWEYFHSDQGKNDYTRLRVLKKLVSGKLTLDKNSKITIELLETALSTSTKLRVQPIGSEDENFARTSTQAVSSTSTQAVSSTSTQTVSSTSTEAVSSTSTQLSVQPIGSEDEHFRRTSTHAVSSTSTQLSVQPIGSKDEHFDRTSTEAVSSTSTESVSSTSTQLSVQEHFRRTSTYAVSSTSTQLSVQPIGSEDENFAIDEARKKDPMVTTIFDTENPKVILGYNAYGQILRARTTPSSDKPRNKYEMGAHKYKSGNGLATPQSARIINDVKEDEISQLPFKKSGLYIVKMNDGTTKYYQVTRSNDKPEVIGNKYGKTRRKVIELKKFKPQGKIDLSGFKIIEEAKLQELFSNYEATQLYDTVELKLNDTKSSNLAQVPVEVRAIIRKNALFTFIDQYEVDHGVFIARNAGYSLEVGLHVDKPRLRFLNIDPFRKLLEHLEILHQNGIVHRDIKPANMFLGKSYEINISDFDGLGRPGIDFKNKFGTPAYCDEELVKSHRDISEQIKNDKVCMLRSLIESTSNMRPPISMERFYAEHNKNPNQKAMNAYNKQSADWGEATEIFVDKYVIAAHRKSVHNFLINPVTHDIPKLSEILLFT